MSFVVGFSSHIGALRGTKKLGAAVALVDTRGKTNVFRYSRRKSLEQASRIVLEYSEVIQFPLQSKRSSSESSW